MNNLSEIAIYFFRLGCIGFGGPLALVAMMEKDLVEKRGWLTIEEFNSAISLIKILPGTFAFQTAVFIGRRRGGLLGGVLAGLGLVTPAFLMMCGLAKAFEIWGTQPNFKDAMDGFEIGALALVSYSIVQISRPYKKHSSFYVYSAISFGIMATGKVPEPLIIVALGFVSVFWNKMRASKQLNDASLILTLMWIAFKSGAFVFGSGLAIAPLMEADFVDKYHWVDHSTFLTALAFGQMTPGPVLVTITFLGYKLAGVLGALLATICVFLPSALHMLTWFPTFFRRVSKIQGFKDFAVGAIGGVIGAIVLFVVKLGNQFLGSVSALVLLAICLVLLVKWKMPSWLIVIGSGLGYYALHLINFT